MKRFEKKVALVTGAARGIGREIALCLAEEGADLVLNDLPPGAGSGAEDVRETAAAVEALGSQAMVYYADVASREQVTGMFKAAMERFDQIDLVVANAAKSIRELVIEARWDNVLKTIEVTQFGVFFTCQLGAQHLVAQAKQGRPGGKIIIIGSVHAHIPFIGSAAYDMAKAAINQFGRTLAAELAEYRINVNIINPGWIDTPGERQRHSPAELAAGAKRIPWGRLGLPRDIAHAVAYLASAEADYLTGSILTVDGGFSLGLHNLER